MPLLSVQSLKMHFPFSGGGVFKKTKGVVKAVDGVTFDVTEGETLGLVGESGCGKSTLGRCILRVYDPTEGKILFNPNGAGDKGAVDLARLTYRELLPYRQQIRMIFQDPRSSLNPRLTVLEIIGEALKVNGIARGRELEDRVKELMARVGLRPEYLHRYPHAFSGGERQRIGIAAALSVSPRLVVADEAVSALDVSVQAQTLNLLEELQEEFQLTYIFVAHNLSVVQHISDRVLVMYVGRMVELAETAELYRNPLHPYTEALMSAVPLPDPKAVKTTGRIRLEGDVADPASPPPGCNFHPRCRYATERCRVEVPEMREVRPGRVVACHRAEELNLVGIRKG
ncbi:MAG: ATP-binding cassette domain-containing protein [Spirochaetaceae bacterium]|nr:MAG: ATP-binding cassette domain-containing protein [Spirochaetaceae bacterium]